MYVHHANITDLPLRFPQVRVLLPRDQHPERGEHPDPRRVRVRRVQPAGERIAQPRVGVAHVCERVEDDVPEADVSAAERGVLCRRRGGAGGDALRGGCVSTFFCLRNYRNTTNMRSRIEFVCEVAVGKWDMPMANARVRLEYESRTRRGMCVMMLCLLLLQRYAATIVPFCMR